MPTFTGYVYVLEVTHRVGAVVHLQERIETPGEDPGEKIILPIDSDMLIALSAVYPPPTPRTGASGNDAYRVEVSYDVDENGKPSLTRQIRIPPA